MVGLLVSGYWEGGRPGRVLQGASTAGLRAEGACRRAACQQAAPALVPMPAVRAWLQDAARGRLVRLVQRLRALRGVGQQRGD